MILTDYHPLAPADAEQAHLLDEIAHPEFVKATHALARRCGSWCQPSERRPSPETGTSRSHRTAPASASA